VEQELPSTLNFKQPDESLPLTNVPDHLGNDGTSNNYIVNEGIGSSLEDTLGKRPTFCSPGESDMPNEVLDLVPTHQPVGWRVWIDDHNLSSATGETLIPLPLFSQTLERFKLFQFDPLNETPLRLIHEPLRSSCALCEGAPNMSILAPRGVMFPFQVH